MPAITSRRERSRGWRHASSPTWHASRTGWTIPRSVRARENPRIEALLGWSRFPYFDLADGPEGVLVTFTDLRFGSRVGRTTVFVPR